MYYYGNKKKLKVKGWYGLFWDFFYHKNMGRPPKEKNLLMNRPLRIMLTAEQDKLIRRAAELEGVDIAAWVRPILLQVAKEQVEKAAIGKKSQK